MRDSYEPLLESLVSVRSTPRPVTVTTRIITFLIGNPYKPSFVTVTGWGGRSKVSGMFCLNDQWNFGSLAAVIQVFFLVGMKSPGEL